MALSFPSQKDVFDVMFHPFVMLWLGQALHFFKALKELEVDGQQVKIGDYIKRHPYSLMFSIIAGFVAYGFLYSTDQLSPIGSFTAGYMADSLINSFVTKSLERIGNTPLPVNAAQAQAALVAANTAIKDAAAQPPVAPPPLSPTQVIPDNMPPPV